jgi:glycosyltransferase involved in cell wall biosynthesis/tetratricopeptide (TPR) repeat protein
MSVIAHSGNAGEALGIVPKGELMALLTRFEQESRDGLATAIQELRHLGSSAEHWALRTRQVGQLRRLAKLLKRAGESAQAIKVLQCARSICPDDPLAASLLTDLLTTAGRLSEALEVVRPHTSAAGTAANVLAIAARLHHRIGDDDESLRLLGEAARKDQAFRVEFLEALTKAGRKEQALAEADRIFAADTTDPKARFACYAAFMKLGDDVAKALDARARVFEHASKGARDCLWRARAFKLEGDLEAGFAELRTATNAAPAEPWLVKERATFALALGHWGRDAKYLLEARALVDSSSALAREIAEADLLLRACGVSLEEAGATPSSFDHVRAPETAFEVIVKSLLPPPDAAPREGLVMIIGSLAGGGAERVLANTLSSLSRDRRFAWLKLYVCDLAQETSKDFYLPLSGLKRADVVVLDHECKVEPPLSWLGRWRAQQAQRILNRLKQDRPAVVHASLEPLNLLAGLSALLAGVPRIVLHTHNMRPTELAIRDAPRLRECYRALLTCKEVSLVGCAHACVEDYAKWLELKDKSNTHAVHNGFNVEEIIAASGSSSRAGLRTVNRIDPDVDVIGTAFRFTAVKQPFLWVDAARHVLAERPNCRFIMYGDGELRSAVWDYIRTKGVSRHFTLPGQVKDLYRRLPLLDLFMLSSRSEALPNVLLESQAAGVPVVAFDVGGIAETMIDGVTGFLVKERSADALANGILRALGTPGWRRSASAAAQEFVRENFSIERMVHNLSGILLKGGGPSGYATRRAG